jgi:hypothetical protein
VAIGAGALQSQSFNPGFAWVSGNVAIGFEALRSNEPTTTTNGYLNTAVGTQALKYIMTGSQNSAFGVEANSASIESSVPRDASGNCAFGYQALLSNAQGTYNVGVGYQALKSLTSGIANTAIGPFAGSAITTGTNNIAIGTDDAGQGAGSQITTGNNNIDIGNIGDPSDNTFFNNSGVIRIGTVNVHVKTVIAGISGNDLAGSGAAVYVNPSGKLGTLNSSRRFKTDIGDMNSASEALFSFRPVSFRYKSEPPEAKAPQSFGLVAEEVAEVNPDLVLRDAKGEIYSVRYEAVNAMLLNEFLKDHRRVEVLQKENAGMREENAAMKKQLAELAARMSKLEQLIPAREASVSEETSK